MGACNYSFVWKNCATCDCWSGPRKTNGDLNGVTVDSSAVGQCGGFWKGSRKFGNNKCPEWKQWATLTGAAGEAPSYP